MRNYFVDLSIETDFLNASGVLEIAEVLLLEAQAA